MDIRQLRYFLSVVREGSVGAAARLHFVTQPAITLQMQRLQESVGETLLVREGGRMVPTEAGRVLAGHAEAVVRRMEVLEAEMSGLRGLERGSLRVGNIDAASVYVLPDLYQAFHERYPGVTLEIAVGDTRELMEALRHGNVELATTTLPVEAEGFEVFEIYREELVPVAPATDPLSSHKRVTPGSLARAGVITYPRGSTTRRLIDAAFAEAGAPLRPRMEISSPEAIKRLAQAGLGPAILPEPVVADELESGALVRLRMGPLRIERAIGMVHRERAALSPAARAFLDMVLARSRA
jgi:DNA-binding transcriptional LysR family regulator